MTFNSNYYPSSMESSQSTASFNTQAVFYWVICKLVFDEMTLINKNVVEEVFMPNLIRCYNKIVLFCFNFTHSQYP